MSVLVLVPCVDDRCTRCDGLSVCEVEWRGDHFAVVFVRTASPQDVLEYRTVDGELLEHLDAESPAGAVFVSPDDKHETKTNAAGDPEGEPLNARTLQRVPNRGQLPQPDPRPARGRTSPKRETGPPGAA
jgi:hypothetical protein